ncbi:hypothetical protein [Vibrio caribbeanicus]|uniref:hypothetical protein n=1 Tax=Vibrio caribbeanicus TaxID=701175 RepID=UPI002284C0EC|nr:hypothetical protein [Vibrio caribbeanicus]MCY9844445.1 hypothetical protein [Vibrio caribbeanicus]
MKVLLLSAIAALLVGCTGPQMVSGSEQVRISKINPDENKYEFVSEVSCDFGMNFVTVSTNLRNCRNDLKNKAAQVSASLVVVESESIGNSGCSNCVSMFGSAYTKR